MVSSNYIIYISCFWIIYNSKGSEACDRYVFYQEQKGTDVHVDGSSSNRSWPGYVVTLNRNYTEIDLQWDPVDVNMARSLCAFAVHYLKNGSHLMFYVPPNETVGTMTDLSPGTMYSIYVLAIFENPVQIMQTWKLIASTNGFGPDNPCGCNPLGTVNGDVNDCDRFSDSAQCNCKSTATGDLCDSCIFGTYMDIQFGCSTCNQCDPVGSLGTCRPVVTGGMQCDCVGGFSGKRCNQCMPGLYETGNVCVPCNCSGNEDLNIGALCNSAGICLSCSFNTQGEHCESCLPGFDGDALKQSCARVNNPTRDIVIGVLASVLGILIIVMIVLVVWRHQQLRNRYQTGLNRLASISGSDGFHFSTLAQSQSVSELPSANGSKVAEDLSRPPARHSVCTVVEKY